MFSRLRPGKPRDDPNREDGDDKQQKVPYKLQRPANTALRQQRLKAWQPLLTHSTVLPLLFGIGVLFAILGGVLYHYHLQVNQVEIDYTNCRYLQPNAPPSTIPKSKYKYYFRNMNMSEFREPQWQMQPIPRRPPTQPSFRCTLHFSVPNTMDQSVFLYYKLTNYFQNHRRYIKNLDYQQLMGHPRKKEDLQKQECKPLGNDTHLNKAIYPCGLIANSVFNDTFADPLLHLPDGRTQSYTMSEKNIAWPGEKNRYRVTRYKAEDIVPPPFWRGSEGGPFSYPDHYEPGKIFDPTTNEHFQVWMQTAAFPTFNKLYKRNDERSMQPGRYTLVIEDNYPVHMFHGTKWLVLTTTTWMGGRNAMIGGSFIGLAGLCVLLGIAFTFKQLVRPRQVGDLNYLSWNRPSRPTKQR